VVRELEAHVAAAGWDQPLRLFALVPTAQLVSAEPELAASLALSPHSPGWTPVEQDDLPEHRDLGDLLARLAWPEQVDGVALVTERVVLPAAAERAVLEATDDVGLAAAVSHPDRDEVRVAVAVTRRGATGCAVRLRRHDSDDAVLTGPDLVPALCEALATTLLD
jgi:hypothetical protein